MNTLILQYLKANGEGMDVDIAQALRMPMKLVTADVAQLSSAGEVVCCNVTRFVNGKKVEGISCRLSLSTPAAKPGPKSGGQHQKLQDV